MRVQPGQTITSLGINKFRLEWLGVKDSAINLDFNPLINQHQLTGNYILLHWQARPKNLRTWGIYDSKSKKYFSVGSDEIKFPTTQPRIVDIPESSFKTLPTAVLYFPISIENVLVR